MRVWTIINQKGGAGKTVLATNLSVEGSSQGMKTLLIDLDAQESATKWWEGREADLPLLIKCPHTELSSNLVAAKKEGFDLVVIDTAGRDSLRHTESVELASFCIVPCQPSLDDCRSSISIVDLIKNYNKKFSFIITRCPSSGDDFIETKNSLSAIGLVCSAYTGERKCYKRAYAHNMSVSEFDNHDKGAGEIKNIFEWIQKKEDRLNK